jgi:two-component system phosphate regulon sensor histidine kinase PhoR
MFWQHPEQREEYIEALLEKGYARNYECHALTKDGKKIVVELNSHLIYDKSGKPIRVDGTFKDITEKYVLSEKLKQSEQKFRNLYENTPFSILLINSLGMVVDCNSTAEQLTGYDRNEIIGNKFYELNIIHPESISLVSDLFKRFIKGERLHRVDIRIYNKDNKVIWVNLQAALIHIGHHTYVQAIFTDITASKEAELLVIEEVNKLKELDKLRKNLISRVSHELKTPIVSISGGTELLMMLYRDQFKEEALEIFSLIEKGGNRLKQLVDSLIDISKIEYDKFKLDLKSEDLSEIISDNAKEMAFLIRERKIKLNLSIPDSLYIKVDKIRIEQVITNLLSNAIKNTPPNGDVRIHLRKLDNFVELIVSDDGIGLTRDEMDFLFTRFGKIERLGEGFEYLDIQGTGLGLYIAKEIVDLHKGEIKAESEGRNKGSKFIVKLPIT